MRLSDHTQHQVRQETHKLKGRRGGCAEVIYSIGFSVRGELQEHNGQKYIHIDGNAGVLLKELSGEYPSMWSCRPVGVMLPIFDHALMELTDHADRYEYFSDGKFGTIEEIMTILKELIDMCGAFPDAVLEVDW